MIGRDRHARTRPAGDFGRFERDRAEIGHANLRQENPRAQTPRRVDSAIQDAPAPFDLDQRDSQGVKVAEAASSRQIARRFKFISTFLSGAGVSIAFIENKDFPLAVRKPVAVVFEKRAPVERLRDRQAERAHKCFK